LTSPFTGVVIGLQKEATKVKSDEELKAKTMKDLILPAFELISDHLVSQNITPEWIKGADLQEIKFTDEDGEACAFSARAETRRKTLKDKKSFPVVVFNFRRGNLRTSNTGFDRVEGLTPAMVLVLFKNIFLPWFR
jgi:hypothetical protein